MVELPEFFDEMDEHSQQMFLAHAAMQEDVSRACMAFHGEYFKTPERRTKDFLLEGLAWAASGGAWEALRVLDEAEHFQFVNPDSKHIMFQLGQAYAAYRVIRNVYQSLRSHDMLREPRSEHWAKLKPSYLALYNQGF